MAKVPAIQSINGKAIQGRRTHLQMEDQMRRLVRNNQKRIDGSLAMILVAIGRNSLQRNAHP
jgi:hypothetical protein